MSLVRLYPPITFFTFFRHLAFRERCRISTTEENARKKRILLVDITLPLKYLRTWGHGLSVGNPLE
jgi:hypothetical protein